VHAPDALTLAVELGKVLEAEKLPYAIGGALALGIHGVALDAGRRRERLRRG
jgi:hypothetical protein